MERCTFALLSRTYNSAAAPGLWRTAEWLPGVAAAQALRPGERALFTHVSSGGGVRASVGLASWSAEPVRALVRVSTPGGALLSGREVEVPTFGHVRLDVDADVVDGRVEVELADAPEQALLVPYVSMVDGASGLPAHRLPDGPIGHLVPEAWAPPLPRSIGAQ
jgi:hypothetical protein